MYVCILPTVCKLADTNDVPVNKVNCNIVEAIERLQRDFRQRVANIRSSFESISVSAIKELLKELPAGEVKGQVGLLLNKSDNFSGIMSSDDIDQLFRHLSNIQAWDFLHPQLLEYLVQELGDDDAKRNMEEYKSHLVQFHRTTKMSELSGWFGNIPETSTFRKVVISLGENWKDRTYDEFEVLRISLLRQQVFFQSSLHLCGVLTGSILVALAIPESVDVAMMKQMLDEPPLLKFLIKCKICAIYTEGLCLIRNIIDSTPGSSESAQYTHTETPQVQQRCYTNIDTDTHPTQQSPLKDDPGFSCAVQESTKFDESRSVVVHGTTCKTNYFPDVAPSLHSSDITHTTQPSKAIYNIITVSTKLNTVPGHSFLVQCEDPAPDCLTDK